MDRQSEKSVFSGQESLYCAGCEAAIVDRFYLKALDKIWHEDCLKCACCDCRLGEVGSSCFTKANLILCRRDYLRLFGNMGSCSACDKNIPAFELVMRANGNVYHLECFACFECRNRFCVGDRFYLWNNHILCEADYEEKVQPLLNTDAVSIGLNDENMHSNSCGGLRNCMPHAAIVSNLNHLTCIVNEPTHMGMMSGKSQQQYA
ncbi:hypothetical protein RvY_05252 [Ramazzottius varieornatus]|uniref:LIM zinc-binding domain-containing protein n=1 Tax=Ramazzottius varieornatus TaxID=947166 RepID=A0A1D1V137_RAMVA|nr:hypothetical protein RvY_05252 [Ramazzottius varieornatus]